MGRNTHTPFNEQTGISPVTGISKRLNSYFALVIISYVIVAGGAGLYLVLGAQILNIELGKFVQYPTSIPFLINLFVSCFLIYVCVMIKEHMKNDSVLYKEDTYILYCMMFIQVLFFNYLSLVPTVLVYLHLRKNMYLSKFSYPKKEEPNKFITAITEKTFYTICFVLLGLTVIFALLLGGALLQKS